MQTLLNRLGRLETAITVKPPSKVCRFVVQGPHGLTADAAADFLLEQGHDLSGSALHLIRVVVDAENGHPIDLPLADLTVRGPS